MIRNTYLILFSDNYSGYGYNAEIGVNASQVYTLTALSFNTSCR